MKVTYDQIQSMVGTVAHLGDIVGLGIEPGEPVGRIVAFYAHPNSYAQGDKRRSHVVVQNFDGELRMGALGVAYVGICRSEDWDGPTPNHLAEFIWREAG